MFCVIMCVPNRYIRLNTHAVNNGNCLHCLCHIGVLHYLWVWSWDSVVQKCMFIRCIKFCFTYIRCIMPIEPIRRYGGMWHSICEYVHRSVEYAHIIDIKCCLLIVWLVQWFRYCTLPATWTTLLVHMYNAIMSGLSRHYFTWITCSPGSSETYPLSLLYVWYVPGDNSCIIMQGIHILFGLRMYLFVVFGG